MESARFLIPVMSQEDVPFVHALGNELKQRGYDVRYIPQNKRLTLRDSKKIIDEDLLETTHISSPPKRNFSNLIKKYDIRSPRKVVFPQMVYDYQYTNTNHQPFVLGSNTIDYEPYFDILHQALDVVDRLYQENAGLIPIQHQGAEVLRRVVQRVAMSHDVESIWVGNSPLDDHAGFYADEYVNWETFEDEYLVEMNDADRHRAREYVEQVRKSKPFTGDRVDQDVLSLESILDRAPGRIRRLLSSDHDSKAMIDKWIRSRGRRVGKMIKSRVGERYCQDKAQSARTIERSKYVFLPIQVIRESRVTVRARPYYDILWIIEYLSRSLPHEYKLVIKDHPDHAGSLPLTTMRKIPQFAEFLHPNFNAHRIIKQSDVVVTLNNTVGYEALLHGKAVIVLGSAFYDGLRYVKQVDDVNAMPDAVSDAIESGGLTKTETLEFVHRVLEGSYPGEWGKGPGKNVQRVADSILEYHGDVTTAMESSEAMDE